MILQIASNYYRITGTRKIQFASHFYRYKILFLSERSSYYSCSENETKRKVILYLNLQLQEREERKMNFKFPVSKLRYSSLIVSISQTTLSITKDSPIIRRYSQKSNPFEFIAGNQDGRWRKRRARRERNDKEQKEKRGTDTNNIGRMEREGALVRASLSLSLNFSFSPRFLALS